MGIGEQRGFTLLGLLFLVAGLGVGLAAVGSLWHTVSQREKERELLFIGRQFSAALDSYRAATQGGVPANPPSLEVLLADNRFPQTVRHLRRLWRDPMTGKPEWGLVRDDAGGILAVYSLSPGAPLKAAGFAKGQETFAEARHYSDWQFKAREEVQVGGVDPNLQAALDAASQANLKQYEKDRQRIQTCQAELNQAMAGCRPADPSEDADPECGRMAVERYQACVAGG